MSGFQLAANQTSAEYPSPLISFLYTTANTKAVAIGDVVHTETNITKASGLKQVELATDGATSQATVGVVMGHDIDPDNEVVGIPLNHATDRVLFVNTNADALYEVDVTTTTPTSQAIEVTDIGLNVVLNVVASTVGSLSTSGMTIDGDTAASTATKPWRIEGISEFAESGGTTYATKVIVRANQSYLRNATGV